jgi:hypothetical protein
MNEWVSLNFSEKAIAKMIDFALKNNGAPYLSDRRQADSGGVDTDTSKPTGAVRNRRAGAGSKHGQHRKTKVRSENRKLSDTPKIIPNKIPDDW